MTMNINLKELLLKCKNGVIWYFSTLRTDPKFRKKNIGVAGGVVLAIFAVWLWIYTRPVTLTKEDLAPDHILTRATVPEDGPIIVRLPDGVEKSGARKKVTFTPEIETGWGRTLSDRHIVFKLDKPLEPGDIYKITFGDYTQEFKVVRRPQVDIFEPTVGTTVGEYTPINFVFNRAMIPLESLDRTVDRPLPITITPETKGSFIWKNERQLQFIPAEHLVRSSEYTVSIGEGFSAFDGYDVPMATYNFKVLPLDLISVDLPRSYNSPLRYSFNQPVDISKFSVQVTDTTDSGAGKEIETTINYSSYLTYNPKTKQKERIVDRSTIEVFQKHDLHGRDNLWNYNSKYKSVLSAVAPLEGTLTIDLPVEKEFSIGPVITRMEARSEKSMGTSLEVFDPSGTLAIGFAEEVDLNKTSISGKGITSKEYGRKCLVDDNADPNAWIDQSNCKTEADKSVIILSFNPKLFSRGDKFVVGIDKIVSLSGIDLSTKAQPINVTVIPELKITNTSPENGANNAQNHFLRICSTIPIKAKDENNYTKSISADKAFQFYYWGESRLVDREYPVDECKNGEYVTSIGYYLKEGTKYNISLNLEDEFGGAVSKKLSFQTAAVESGNTADMFIRTLNREYNVTTPAKTKFTFASDNWKEVNISVCKLTPENMIKVSGDLRYDAPVPVPCLKNVTKTIQLPAKRNKTDYFIVDIKDYFPSALGQYVISLTNPKYKVDTYINNESKKVQGYLHTLVSVTNLSLVSKTVNRAENGQGSPSEPLRTDSTPYGLYWVTKLGTLEPMEGATVFVYYDKARYIGSRNITLATSATTDAEGIAKTPLVANVTGAYVVSGEDSAVVTTWGDSLNYASEAYNVTKTYVYTDRPIYRPGHEVRWKVISRIGYDAHFDIDNSKPINVYVYDSRGNVIASTSSVPNDYGTISGEMTLPIDAPLGTYRIRAGSANGGDGGADFDVLEYVPSPFEVKLKADKEEYIAKDKMQVEVNAKHYFGVPLDSGKVTYTIVAQDYYFDRSTDKNFTFGSGWYDCYECGGYGDKFVARGEGELTGGVFLIDQDLDFDEMFSNNGRDEESALKSKIFRVSASVEDSNGKSVSAETSFIVHAADFYVSAQFSEPFVQENVSVPFGIKTLDTKGKGIAKSDLNLKIERLEWVKYKRQEVDGSFYYKWEEEHVLVHSATTTTNANGDYTSQFAFPSAGEYQITVSGVDERGNKARQEITEYVYGDDQVPVKPSNDRTLEMAVDNKDYDVGDRPKIIIQSPYEHAKALVSIERGGILDYQVLDVNKSYFEYSFQVRDTHVPNVVVSALLLSGNPEIKYGEARLAINRKNKELKITTFSNKSSYIPGEKVHLSILTTDRYGRPVPAELSIAAVDLSVLALKGNPKRDLLSYFYSDFVHNIITSSNLKFVHEEVEIPTGTKGGDGSGLDESKKRGEFKDTAFWTGEVRTGLAGYAEVTFTLPDNLTRWRVETVGATKDTKVGVNYLEFEEKKHLMALPVIPRFVVPGDKFSVGVKVLNQTGVGQNMNVSLKQGELELLGPANTNVYIEADGAKTVYFNLKAPLKKATGIYNITLSARAGGYVDIVDKTINITENTTFESVSMSGIASGDTASEEVQIPTDIIEDAGGLRVKVNSTVGSYLEDSLNYMVAYPYGCSEQLASKIATLALVKNLTNTPNIGEAYKLEEIEFQGQKYTVDTAIKNGLSRIYEAQKNDGGFAYYKELDSDYSLTLHIIAVLAQLKKAGVSIDNDILARALEYANTAKQPEFNKKEYKNNIYRLDNLIAGTYLLSTIEPRPKLVSKQMSAIKSGITRSSIKQLSSMSLAYALLMSDDLGWWDKRGIWNEVNKRMSKDADGQYLRSTRSNVSWDYYETGSADTALLLRAIMKFDKNTDKAKDMLRWLLANRQADGSWATTNTTAIVVETLTDYIKWKDENNADFSLDVLLGNEKYAKYDTASSSDRLHGLEINVPFSKLGLGTQTTVNLQRNARGGRKDTYYYDLSLRYFLDREVIPARSEGVTIERNFYNLSDKDRGKPLQSAKVGDVIVGRINWSTPKPMRLFGLQDMLPGGVELIDFNLATENKGVIDAHVKEEIHPDIAKFMRTPAFAKLKEVLVYADERDSRSVANSGYTNSYEPDFKELHDDRLFLFSQVLPAGSYSYEYYVRVLTPGKFLHLPALGSELYNPEYFGRTSSKIFTVER